jgi:hypothetical protein
MDPSKQWVVAIEFIFYFDLFGGGSFVAAYPQVHWIASTNFELQGSILRIRSQTSHILDKFPPKQLTYM